ncbi:MAG: hypothetical protein U1F14_02685 [Steroidobacteraceae bacterium]
MLQGLRHHRLRTPLVRLLLVAMVLRALVPVGFMPAADAGWPSLQICGPAAMLLSGGDDLSAQAGGATHPGTAHEACPFALSPAAAPLPPLVFADLFVPAAAAAPDEPSLIPPARAVFRAHRPRGPPSPA